VYKINKDIENRLKKHVLEKTNTTTHKNNTKKTTILPKKHTK